MMSCAGAANGLSSVLAASTDSDVDDPTFSAPEGLHPRPFAL
jgi:hypothetical protein